MRASQRRRGVRFEVRAACRAGPDGLIALPGCSPALLRAIPTLTRPTLARYLSADAQRRLVYVLFLLGVAIAQVSGYHARSSAHSHPMAL